MPIAKARREKLLLGAQSGRSLGSPLTLELVPTTTRILWLPLLAHPLVYVSVLTFSSPPPLWFQAYYQDAPFPCELVATESLQGLKRRRDGISIRRLLK